MQPVRSDITARDVREACVRNAERCSVCALHAAQYDAGYRMVPLADPAQVADRPIRTIAQYPGSCVHCARAIAEGDVILWSRVQGAKCERCGGVR